MSVDLFLNPLVGVAVLLLCVGVVFQLVRVHRLKKKGVATSGSMFVVNGRGNPSKKNKTGFRGETAKGNPAYGSPSKGMADYFTPNLTANALSSSSGTEGGADS